MKRYKLRSRQNCMVSKRNGTTRRAKTDGFLTDGKPMCDRVKEAAIWNTLTAPGKGMVFPRSVPKRPPRLKVTGRRG
jgi:hypothetical protein